MHRSLARLVPRLRLFITQRRHTTRASIAGRLRWSYLLSSTLPLLLVGTVLLWINASAQEQSVYNDQKNVANSLSRSIATYMGDLRQQLQTYMLIVRPGSTQPEQWQSDATSIQVRNYPKIVSIAITDLSGNEIMRVRGSQSQADQLRDASMLPDVQRALAGQASYSSMAVDATGTRTFTMTLPLPNDAGTIIGTLEAEIRGDAIMQELSAATNNADVHAFVARRDTMQVVFDDAGTGTRAPNSLAQLFASQTATTQYANQRGETIIGVMSAVTLLPDAAPTSWAVVVERPASAALAGVRTSIPVLILLIMLVGMAALWWAFRQAHALLQPLAALRKGALEVGEGNLGYRITHVDNDELGDVAQTFNIMADHLQRSLDEIERQNERLRHGLALARDIQVGLLPDRAPWPSGTVDVYARSLPAHEVGGDFYTYLAMPDNRAAIAIGDISGKGVGAALMMALTSSTLESQARQIEHPATLLAALNTTLASRLKANHMNAALLFAILDTQASTVRVANAGMIAPIIISPCRSQLLDVGGLPVGAYAQAIYQEVTVPLAADDVLLLVSDGVVEAHDAQNHLFGFERLEASIAALQGTRDIRVLVEGIITDVQAFIGDQEQHDDITVVAVQPMMRSEEPLLIQEQPTRYAAF